MSFKLYFKHNLDVKINSNQREVISFLKITQDNFSETKELIQKSIDTFKPTIFWKEKEIVKEQIKILSYQKIQEILLRANEIELLSKKNPILSTTITTNFLIEIAA